MSSARSNYARYILASTNLLIVFSKLSVCKTRTSDLRPRHVPGLRSIFLLIEQLSENSFVSEDSTHWQQGCINCARVYSECSSLPTNQRHRNTRPNNFSFSLNFTINGRFHLYHRHVHCCLWCWGFAQERRKPFGRPRSWPTSLCHCMRCLISHCIFDDCYALLNITVRSSILRLDQNVLLMLLGDLLRNSPNDASIIIIIITTPTPSRILGIAIFQHTAEHYYWHTHTHTRL